MANYVIGDLQGCFGEFKQLLQQVDFNPSKDHLYLVGDIVARGPDSLACLDYLYQYQDSITVTLGNHDLHLIACYHRNKKPNPKDNLSALFASPKLANYIALLQQQPLALWLDKQQTFISHAGLNPLWSVTQALEYAKFAEQCYQGNDAFAFFNSMYMPHPTNNINKQSSQERFRYIVNYFTRMRFLNANNQLDLSAKGKIDDSNTLMPWFAHHNLKGINFEIMFGHWAALEGITQNKNVHALDTGCVWGGVMTLIELSSKQRFTENSHLFT